MFIGHAAAGFAAKRAAPQASLGAVMTAPYLLDLLWPIFVLAGWEEVRIEPGATVVSPLNFVRYPISAADRWPASDRSRGRRHRAPVRWP